MRYNKETIVDYLKNKYHYDTITIECLMYMLQIYSYLKTEKFLIRDIKHYRGAIFIFSLSNVENKIEILNENDVKLIDSFINIISDFVPYDLNILTLKDTICTKVGHNKEIKLKKYKKLFESVYKDWIIDKELYLSRGE